MTCLAIGLGVLGFIALRRARRCHGGGCGHHGWYGHGGGHGWGGHHGWGGQHRRRPWLYAVLARLDATPAQERVIVSEIDKVQERIHAAKGGLRDGRSDLAAALRAHELDDAALGALLGRVDGTTTEVRAAVLDALRNIHTVLDDRQRQALAEMVEGGWWRRGPMGGSPYRV